MPTPTAFAESLSARSVQQASEVTQEPTVSSGEEGQDPSGNCAPRRNWNPRATSGDLSGQEELSKA